MSALNLFLLMTAGFLLMLWWDLRLARRKLLERTRQSRDPIDLESLRRNSPNIVFARSIPSDIIGLVLGASGTLLYAGVISPRDEGHLGRFVGTDDLLGVLLCRARSAVVAIAVVA
jgi:hypothetical protein